MQLSVKGLAERVVERQPIVSAEDMRRAIIAARDASGLEEYRAALILGRVHICGNCDAFRFGQKPAELGHCNRYDTEAAPFCPFQCPGFHTARTPTAPACLPDPDGARARAREYGT